MWTNKQSSNPSGSRPGTQVATAPDPVPAVAVTPHVPAAIAVPHATGARTPAWLGPELKIKGEISGSEDLQVECRVDGPISLEGHRLTIGQNSHVNGDISASEVVVLGEVGGDILASARIEIKKHGSVRGNLTTARIMIEDGAYFKGAIEIVRKSQPELKLETLLARPEKKAL